MNNKLIPLIFSSTFLLAGCVDQTKEDTSTIGNAPVVSKEDAIAEVNGVFISKKTLQKLEEEFAQRNQGQTFPKEKLVEELVRREILVQDALAKQLDKSPEFTEQLSTIRFSLLSQAALKDYIDSNPVTDEEVKAEYDEKMAGTGSEYKASHILVKTEDEAKKIIEELNKGADFVDLAKTKSTGPSGPQGGDLGWFTPDRMVPPFSEAVVAMENGKFTTAPVETQFGWHVILREDSRSKTPPPFDSVKDRIRPMLQRNKIQSMMENLRNQAKVEILIPLTEEKPQAESTPPPALDQPVDQVNPGTAEKLTEEADAETNSAISQVKNKIKDAAQKVTEKGNEAIKDTANKALDAVK